MFVTVLHLNHNVTSEGKDQLQEKLWLQMLNEGESDKHTSL